MLSLINRILISLIILLLLAMAMYFYLKSDVRDPQQLDFSQFISLQTEDEYVIAKMTTNETFTTNDTTSLSLLGQQLKLGSTEVTVALVAHYKYYISLARLKHRLEADTLVIYAPPLQVSKPVAFEFSSVRESSDKSLLGPDDDVMMLQLKHTLSDELVIKGLKHMPAVYDMAARSLADNLNSFIKANGNAGFYSSITVLFENEKNPPIRQYHYDNSFCQPGPCTLEMQLETGKTLVIP